MLAARPSLKGRALTLLKFQAAGAPAFALAIPLNWALVEKGGLAHAPAYLLVLLFQVAFNYVMCRRFVFPAAGERGFFAEFLPFVSGVMVIRVLDWLTYQLWVGPCGVYYLVAQILNVPLFAIVKFLFAERLLGAARRGRARQSARRQT